MLVFRSALAVSRQACAQNARTRYPTMAPLNQYLMAGQNAEIALARNAAPASISSDATVLVLEKTDTRLQPIERMGSHAWLSARRCLQSTDFSYPARGRTIFPFTIKRATMALAGLSKAQMRESITAATEKNELPMSEAGAMSYILSKSGDLGDFVGTGASQTEPQRHTRNLN